MKKKTKILIAAAVVLAVVTLGAAWLSNRGGGSYTGYEVIASMERTDGASVRYAPYGDNIIRYSQDGASALKPDGTVLWNGSYEMNEPALDVCGNYAVVADIGGTNLYVYNGSDSGTQVTTLNPILQAAVASQGVVAVLMEENDSNEICLYDPYSSTNPLVYDVPTNVSSDGFPVNIAVSPDGKKLATNFVNVSNGQIESRLTFYNFDEYGKNVVDHIVSGKEYGEELITKIVFLSNETACVLTEHGFTIFQGAQIPKESYTVTLEEPIRNAFAGNDWVGLITEEEQGVRIRLYRASDSKPVMDEATEFEYERIFFDGRDLILYTGLACQMWDTDGHAFFSYTFPQPVAYLLGTGERGRYLLIHETELQEISLTRSQE